MGVKRQKLCSKMGVNWQKLWSKVGSKSILNFIQTIHSFMNSFTCCTYSQLICQKTITLFYASYRERILSCCVLLVYYTTLAQAFISKHSDHFPPSFSFFVPLDPMASKTLIYFGCTEKPDTVRYADTVRYKTDLRGSLNTLAREIFPLFFKV